MIEDRNAAKPIVIAGHSHSVCFGLPHAKQEGVRLVELRQDPLIFGVEAPWPRPTDFTEQVCALAKGKKLLLSYSGWSKLLFAPDPLFDFVSSHFPSLPLDPEARLLPESLVLNHDDLRLYPRWINNAFRLFQRGGIDDMLILCMPPPKGDNDILRTRLRREPLLVQRAGDAGLDIDAAKIMPPFIRLKLWGLIHQITKQEAAAVGAAYVGVPPECQDGYGFLKEEYWASDVTHANRKFGGAYLSHILKSLQMVQ